MSEGKSSVLYIVRTWVPEEQFAEWEKWHSEVHVPDVASQPQVRRARRYRVAEDSMPAEWKPQVTTVYDFDSLDDFEAYRASAAGIRLREDYAKNYGATGKISRQILVLADDFS